MPMGVTGLLLPPDEGVLTVVGLLVSPPDLGGLLVGALADGGSGGHRGRFMAGSSTVVEVGEELADTVAPGTPCGADKGWKPMGALDTGCGSCVR